MLSVLDLTQAKELEILILETKSTESKVKLAAQLFILLCQALLCLPEAILLNTETAITMFPAGFSSSFTFLLVFPLTHFVFSVKPVLLM